MATLVATTLTGSNGPVTATRNVLSASDVLPVSSGILELYNTTGSPVVVTIDGSTATTIAPAGFGGTVDISAGKAITVPATGTVILNLATISAFLSGTIAVTGGTGVTAHLYV
jgi:hypothetical protein